MQVTIIKYSTAIIIKNFWAPPDIFVSLLDVYLDFTEGLCRTFGKSHLTCLAYLIFTATVEHSSRIIYNELHNSSKSLSWNAIRQILLQVTLECYISSHSRFVTFGIVTTSVLQCQWHRLQSSSTTFKMFYNKFYHLSKMLWYLNKLIIVAVFLHDLFRERLQMAWYTCIRLPWLIRDQNKTNWLDMQPCAQIWMSHNIVYWRKRAYGRMLLLRRSSYQSLSSHENYIFVWIVIKLHLQLIDGVSLM